MTFSRVIEEFEANVYLIEIDKYHYLLLNTLNLNKY